MSVFDFKQIKKEALFDVAQKMVVAAITAPKAGGRDCVVAAVVDREDIEMLAKEMKKLVKNNGAMEFVSRDADNILGFAW